MLDVLERTLKPEPLERKQLQDLTALMGELRHLLVRHGALLKEEGISKEMQQLEHWLEAERAGPAPADVISESGVIWLAALRDRLKLTVEETQRLEGEGGNPGSPEQVEKIESMLKIIRRMDRMIEENSKVKPPQ